MNRAANLMPDGIPKWIRCYDSGPNKGMDRYTVAFTKKAITEPGQRKYFMYLAMSAQPFHPQGIGLHGESKEQPIDRPTYGHLGKRIEFFDLPQDCQKLVIQDYKRLWEI